MRLVIGVLLVYLRVSKMLKFLRAKYRIVEVKEKNRTFYEIHVRSVFSLFLWLSVTEPHWDGWETCNRTVDFKTLKEAEDYIYGGCGGVERKTVKVINT